MKYFETSETKTLASESKVIFMPFVPGDHSYFADILRYQIILNQH